SPDRARHGKAAEDAFAPTAVERRQRREALRPGSVDVLIVGGGPYALSLAHHLRRQGIEHRIFGRPMSAWRHVTPGRYLKSFGFATSIPVTTRGFTLPEYCRARGLEDLEPIAMNTFADYGEWVQRQLIPRLETVQVASLRHADGEFDVTLSTGEEVRGRRVVVATGLSYFEYVPEIFASLPPNRISHTAQLSDFSVFTGRDVTV